MDYCVGVTGLVFSATLVVFLVLRMLVIPVLPLNEEHERLLLPPTFLLLVSGTAGFIFIGSLVLYTLNVLIRGDRVSVYKEKTGLNK